MLLAHFTQPFNSFFPTFYYWSASSATSSILSESKHNQSTTASRFHFCVSSSLVTAKNKEDNANLWILNAGLGSGCGEGEWSESPVRNGSQIHNKAVPCLKRLTVASVHLPHTHTAPKLQIMDSSLQRAFSKESGPKGLLIQATPFLLLKHKDKKKLRLYPASISHSLIPLSSDLQRSAHIPFTVQSFPSLFALLSLHAMLSAPSWGYS